MLRKCYLILALPCAIIHVIIYLIHLLPNLAHDTMMYPGSVLSSARSDQVCIYPKMMLWHPQLSKFFKDVPPLSCNRSSKNWAYSRHGHFYIDEEVEESHGPVQCMVQPIERLASDRRVKAGNVETIQNGDKMPADFLEVLCTGQKGQFFRNIISGIARKDSEKPFTSNIKPTKEFASKLSPLKETSINILMFGFDSVSRMTWMRNLPKTHDFLVNKLGGVVMEGFNILGDGTPNALTPLLTGHLPSELPEGRRGFANARQIDGYPWIWKEFSNASYVTQWGEDGAMFGTFTHRMLGFHNQPTDHYLRPFYIRAEQLYGENRPYCLGSLARHTNMLNWIRDFFEVYRDKMKFSYVFHSEFTHNRHSQVRVMDEELRSFLEDLNNNGHLDNTLLILMSDHGARFHEVRQVLQGKLEERNPYFSFRFPTSFAKANAEAMRNLYVNSKRLVTMFDVHATFLHLLGKHTPNKRGQSLLMEIAKERTCPDAGITPHWCSCLQGKAIKSSHPLSIKTAHILLAAINNITSTKRQQCDELEIGEILSAHVLSPDDQVLQYGDLSHRAKGSVEYATMTDILVQISIEINPGKGRFEATVRHIFGTHHRTIVSADDISRINQYGEQPWCITDSLPHMKPYCHCR